MEIEHSLLDRQAMAHIGQEVKPQAVPFSQMELAKRSFDEIEQEKGTKALAYYLGIGWFQARQHSFAAIEQATQAFFPKLMTNSELLGIFHTAIQHQSEEQVAFDALFNSPHPLSEHEREEKFQQWSALVQRGMEYMKQLVIPQQQPQKTIPPAHCEEGRHYKRSYGVIPLEHVKKCTVSSA